jgi:hypothetical protein
MVSNLHEQLAGTYYLRELLAKSDSLASPLTSQGKRQKATTKHSAAASICEGECKSTFYFGYSEPRNANDPNLEQRLAHG